jgi:hypothetical protein
MPCFNVAGSALMMWLAVSSRAIQIAAHKALTYGEYSKDRMHGKPPVEKPAATSPP